MSSFFERHPGADEVPELIQRRTYFPHDNLLLILLIDAFGLFRYIRNRKAAGLAKRASNVLRLAQENRNLEQELKEMAERLEAAEKRSKELLAKQSNPVTPNEEPEPADKE